MQFSALRLRSAASLLALTLLCGISPGRAGTEASSGERTLKRATLGDTTPIVAGVSDLILTNVSPSEIVLITGNNDLPTASGNIVPGLFGSVNDLLFKTTKRGATRAKATLDLLNTSGTTLRNVTATVYLSDDNTLSADDLQIKKLDLSDYVHKGKIARYNAINLPFNYKVPSVLDSYLNGKYLIVVLSADNLGTLTTNPVVVGPIKLP